MKRIIYISVLMLITATLSAQQFPFMEGYTMNPFGLSPAYAGITNSKTVFVDYRSDWSGLDGGPLTYQLSYNDKLNEKVGLGGRFIYDKTDIFKQTLLLGTYTYEVKISRKHTLNFGLSAGFFRNSIDFAKYYNDPDFMIDQALYSYEKSKIKFASDVSVLYRTGPVKAGILFSNIMFGTAKYRNTALSYKPLKNYLVHASYMYELSDKWLIEPTVIVRGGQSVPAQLEIAPAVTWNSRFWGTALYRTGGVFGVGLGGAVMDGLMLNYSYNMSSNVAISTFGSHQITLGVRMFKINKPK